MSQHYMVRKMSGNSELKLSGTMTEVCRGRGVIHDDCEVGPKTKASREGQTDRQRERDNSKL